MSSGASITADVKDIEKTIKMLNDLGKSPQRAVTKAARQAGLVLKRATISEAPEGKTHMLKKGIYLYAERNHGKRGKKVYEVVINRAFNSMFQKPIQHPGALGGKNSKAYYPSSMEYGFLARDKGGGLVYYSKGVFQTKKKAKEKASWTAKYEETKEAVTTKRVEGRHFMEKAATKTEAEREKILVETTLKELGKIWQSTQ